MPPSSEFLLQRRHAEGLHHGLGRLRLHHHHLAEDLPLPGLRRRLLPRLHHAHARNGELPGLLQLRQPPTPPQPPSPPRPTRPPQPPPLRLTPQRQPQPAPRTPLQLPQPPTPPQPPP